MNKTAAVGLSVRSAKQELLHDLVPTCDGEEVRRSPTGRQIDKGKNAWGKSWGSLPRQIFLLARHKGLLIQTRFLHLFTHQCELTHLQICAISIIKIKFRFSWHFNDVLVVRLVNCPLQDNMLLSPSFHVSLSLHILFQVHASRFEGK